MTQPLCTSTTSTPAKAADSPRWCEFCNAWGNHHTDRHPEPPCAGCGNKISGHVKPWEIAGRLVHPNSRCASAA